MDFENIEVSPELKEMAKACTSLEELLALVKKEGYKLSDDEMEALSGGEGLSLQTACLFKSTM
jgi:hypothetical protein